ncbi:MAG: response regulator [Woeseia sp.]
MNEEALMRRLMKTFLGELEGHVESLERDLLAFERDSGQGGGAAAENLFRTAHSMKGAARAVNVEVIEKAAHRMESVFAAARDDPAALDEAQFQSLFAAVDALSQALSLLRAGRTLEGSVLETLLRAPGLVAPERKTSPQAATEEAPARWAPAGREEGHVRMPAERLDRMIALGGELLVARRRIDARIDDIEALQNAGRRRPTARSAGADDDFWLSRQFDKFRGQLNADRLAIDQVAESLESEVMSARMLPFGEVCQGFDRMVRDLAREVNVQVELQVQGRELQMDRSVAEAIKDPLHHLLRNAVGHAIEVPEERKAAGKPERGRLVLSAALVNGMIEIALSDDGRGFDLPAIREQAAKRGMQAPDDDGKLLTLAFQSGFSTSSSITAISGRGVGLDVVKATVERSRGAVRLDSEARKGSRITIRMPVSLTRLTALLIRLGGQVYVIDSTAVRALMRVAPEEFADVGGRQVKKLEASPAPVFSLAEVLGISGYDRPAGKVPLVLLGSDTAQTAFAVDELLSVQEVVIKDLGSRLRYVRHISGSAVLAGGEIALILNPAELMQTALARGSSAGRGGQQPGRAAKRRKRLLVVEDTATTRILITTILESSGFDIIAAVDGQDAWGILKDSKFDLVVSDIEMPRMDGFQLLEAIRGSKAHRELPVILVTALESEEDRMRGLSAGADAYLQKSTFDQSELIEAIGQIL